MSLIYMLARLLRICAMAAALLLIPAHDAFTQNKLLQVSLIQLIATPEKFDGKVVGVYGFLALGEYPVLWLHKEDGDNLLIPNAVWIVPSRDMQRNSAEIDGKYVTVVGVFRAFRSGEVGRNNLEGTSGGITDIRSCTLWSDPKRPIGHKYDELNAPKLKQK